MRRRARANILGAGPTDAIALWKLATAPAMYRGSAERRRPALSRPVCYTAAQLFAKPSGVRTSLLRESNEITECGLDEKLAQQRCRASLPSRR